MNENDGKASKKFKEQGLARGSLFSDITDITDITDISKMKCDD